MTNGKSGTAGKKGKVPAGVPCTGWYQGKKHSGFCEGKDYGGHGWCGVEAAPGEKGAYNKDDSAWGGCSKECPPSGIAICECPFGTPTKGTACDKHGSKGCEKCNEGFDLNADKTMCIRHGASRYSSLMIFQFDYFISNELIHTCSPARDC